MSKKYTQEEAMHFYSVKGLTLLDEYKTIKAKMKCINSEGYYMYVDLGTILHKNYLGRICHPSNIFSILNINKFLKEKTNDEYECISEKYIGKNDDLLILHKKCGSVFSAKWSNLNRNPTNDSPNRQGTRCSYCDSKQLESVHASILKQVWISQEPDTIIEDRSCINPNTRCALPTDIVNHRMKIAIEVQSWFHDFEDQQKKDQIKKNFWLEQGYQFFSVDQRDYQVLEMIQIFFPEIQSIPSDTIFGNKLNDVKVQKMLNDGISVHQIATELKVNPHRIYDAIQYKRISYPPNYKNASYVLVKQFDLTDKFIQEFKTLRDAERALNFPKGALSSCFYKGKSIYRGYKWICKNNKE